MNDIKITPLLDTLKLQKIDDETYFSEKYANYISNSRLSLINPYQDNDPVAFFEGLSKHNKYSDSLLYGSAVHQLSLQPDLFFLCKDVTSRPSSKAGFMADLLYDQFNGEIPDEDAIIKASDKIDYYKGKMNKKRISELINKCENYWKDRAEYESKNIFYKTPIYLDDKGQDKILNCVSALNKNENIQDLLHPKGVFEDPLSDNEQAILLNVLIEIPNTKPFQLRLKSKLDNYTIDKENNIITVNDVKTIGKIVSEFKNNFEKYHYSREMAMYSWLLSLCAKKYWSMNECTIKSNCLVVSTIPQYYTKVYKVTKKDLLSGFNEFKYLLKLVARYVATEYKDFGLWT